MNLASFLAVKGTEFSRILIENRHGRIYVPPRHIDLHTEALSCATTRSEQHFVLANEEYQLLKDEVGVKPLLTFEWVLTSGAPFSIEVHTFTLSEDRTFLGVLVGGGVWMAVAHLVGEAEPMLLARFFAVASKRVGGRYGFLAKGARLERVVNHRPQMQTAATAMECYGTWLAWMAGRFPETIIGVWDGLRLHGVKTMSKEEEKLKTRFLLVYSEEVLGDDTPGGRSRVMHRVDLNTIEADLRYHRREVERLSWAVSREYQIRYREDDALKLMNWLSQHSWDAEYRAKAAHREGEMLAATERFDEAIAAFGRGLLLEPKELRVWFSLHNNIAYCQNQRGEYDRAEWYARTAIEVDPNPPNAYRNLGVALEGQGRFSEAARQYIEATKHGPSDTRAFYMLGALVDSHPEVKDEIPGFYDAYRECEDATGKAREQSP